MSSTYISVDSNVYSNMQANARRMQTELTNERNRNNESLQREKEAKENYNRNIESLNQRINQMGARSEEEIARLNRNYNQQLINQSNAFSGQINEMRNEFSNELGNLNRSITQIDQQMSEMAEDFSRQFMEIARRKNDEREMALLFLEELNNVVSDIQVLEPNRFAPQAFSDMTSQLAFSRQNIEKENYQAALALLQVNLTQAYRMKERLTYQNRIFIENLTLAQELLNQTRREYDDLNDYQIAIPFDGQETVLECDINHWTHGRKERLEGRLISIADQLENVNANGWVIEDLEAALREISQIRFERKPLEEEAKELLVRSIAVQNSVMEIYNAMNESGWNCVDSGHHNDDNREDYEIRFDDGAGNEMAVIVNSGAQPSQTEINLEIFSEDRNDISRSAIRETQLNHLRESGFPLENSYQRNDCHQNDDARTFFQNIRQTNEPQKNN